MITICFQGKPFNIRVIQVYAPTTNAEEAEVEQVNEDLQELLELILKEKISLHYRGLECKSRMSRVNIDILGISELNTLERVNLIHMTFVSMTVGKNPLEEME